MSRFERQSTKTVWDDAALDALLLQVRAQGEALEVAEEAIEVLQNEDREMSAEQNALATALMALTKASPAAKE